MARVVYVKSARARIDKETKQAKPLRTCDKCNAEIQVGSPYKHISIKTGPFSSRTLIRCDSCPVWNVWEYSNSLSARLAEIEYNASNSVSAASDKDEVETAMSEAAEAIREIAEEKREGAQNIEDGFGHPTTQSDELTNVADELESWADEVEQAEIPDYPDPQDAECEACNGAGKREPSSDDDYAEDDLDQDGRISCPDCDGTGHPSEPTEGQLEEWYQEVESATDVLGNCPV